MRTIQDASAHCEIALLNSWVRWVLRRADNASFLDLGAKLACGKTLAHSCMQAEAAELGPCKPCGAIGCGMDRMNAHTTASDRLSGTHGVP